MNKYTICLLVMLAAASALLSTGLSEPGLRMSVAGAAAAGLELADGKPVRR